MTRRGGPGQSQCSVTSVTASLMRWCCAQFFPAEGAATDRRGSPLQSRRGTACYLQQLATVCLCTSDSTAPQKGTCLVKRVTLVREVYFISTTGEQATETIQQQHHYVTSVRTISSECEQSKPIGCHSRPGPDRAVSRKDCSACSLASMSEISFVESHLFTVNASGSSRRPGDARLSADAPPAAARDPWLGAT